VSETAAWIDAFWDDHIVPTLCDYIRIPNKSPAFDPDWAEHGHMERVLQLALAWIEEHALPGQEVVVGRLPGRTPLILVDVPGDGDGTVLMYGHLDKQPEFVGWREGLGPWEPVLTDEGKLYGRGGADDGYALFASYAALHALQRRGTPHARTVILIEFCEESGSGDLAAYFEHFSEVIGTPDLVVALDSGAGNYDQLWSTTSLRGMASGVLRVDVLTEGVHSGDASGIVPDSFRVARRLLDRIEDAETGAVTIPACHVDVPAARVEQAGRAADFLGDAVWKRFPWAGGTRPLTTDRTEAILNRTWRPTITVTGADGLPASGSAGNVLRTHTALKLSVRLPPTCDSGPALKAIAAALEGDAPHGAKVTFQRADTANGWEAPALAPWLADALDVVSERWYGKPAVHMGEGGTIPFMGMLTDAFPDAQFVITGVLGPNSNAHGPNEFLHVPYAKKLTGCVADLLALHREQHA
jgi:acetylornithine deacetylase/succinyl-diaminopimelate desuccinylase-like protein